MWLGNLRPRAFFVPRSIRVRFNTTATLIKRQSLLSEIYAPFQKLPADSPEYYELARSGKVWEDYFQPADSKKLGYTRLQKVCRPPPFLRVLHPFNIASIGFLC